MKHIIRSTSCSIPKLSFAIALVRAAADARAPKLETRLSRPRGRQRLRRAEP